MKKFERDELLGIFISIVVVVGVFSLLRFEPWNAATNPSTEKNAEGDIVRFSSKSSLPEVTTVLKEAFTSRGTIEKLIVQDVKEGTGSEIKEGSVVKVHYIGMLQDGTQFDNSYEKGEPYEFVVGEGSVIKGWDTGLLGMKEGGERILVIPPALGYGKEGKGPVPADATLLFSVEIVSVE